MMVDIKTLMLAFNNIEKQKTLCRIHTLALFSCLRLVSFDYGQKQTPNGACARRGQGRRKQTRGGKGTVHTLVLAFPRVGSWRVWMGHLRQ